MVEGFILTFSFEDDFPIIDTTLHIINNKIFDDGILHVCQQLDWALRMEHALECYNIAIEENDYPSNIDILEFEG